MTCTDCGSSVAELSKFCSGCGVGLAIQSTNCRNCRSELSVDAKFCPACGTPAAPVAPPVRDTKPEPPSAAQYVPPDVQTKLKTYERYKVAQCPQCGYRGTVGWTETMTPGGWLLWLIIIPLLFFGFGWGLLFYKYWGRKHKCECPNCLAQFAIEPGLKPNWDIVTKA